MPFVSITRLRIRSWWYVPPFLVYAQRSAWQAKTAPANLAVSLLSDRGRIFWTRTIWNDEAAMRSFILSGAHGRSCPRLLEWCDEASVVHWTQDSREPHRGRRRCGVLTRTVGVPKLITLRMRNVVSSIRKRGGNRTEIQIKAVWRSSTMPAAAECHPRAQLRRPRWMN